MSRLPFFVRRCRACISIVGTVYEFFREKWKKGGEDRG